jgi:lantibiotic transport system ATP-binding protein
MRHSIEVKHLSHRFSKQEAVLNNISLYVPQGSIYGFLGPNGAGKTTTLRLILGLLPQQSGEIAIFGQSFEQHRRRILEGIGSLIESPSMYGHLTAKENLTVLQKVYRCPPSRIGAVLEMVDLANTGRKKASQFSLGMKQRLAIAMALLHDPDLLILDEPTNGLDPNGIIEIRELLRRINREMGKTVLVSSHLLAEIEKLATHVGIIHHGNMLFEGSLEALMQRQKETSRVVFKVNNAETAALILQQNKVPFTQQNQRIEVLAPSTEMIAALNRQFVMANIDVYAIEQEQDDLETIFMNLTN